jgi:hypothetical protein
MVCLSSFSLNLASLRDAWPRVGRFDRVAHDAYFRWKAPLGCLRHSIGVDFAHRKLSQAFHSEQSAAFIISHRTMVSRMRIKSFSLKLDRSTSKGLGCEMCVSAPSRCAPKWLHEEVSHEGI